MYAVPFKDSKTIGMEIKFAANATYFVHVYSLFWRIFEDL